MASVYEQILAAREDMTEWLIHFTRGQPPATARDMLLKILSEGLLRPGWALRTTVNSGATNRTVFGRHIYAIGGNRHAAELSGIKTRRVDFWLFVNMGFLAALAGLIFTARLNLAGPKAGDGFELEAISAAFIGGAAVQGGVGTIGGAIIGGLIIGVLNNGMSILGIGIEWQQAVKGLVLLLAVAFDVYNKRRSGGQ